jgi:hypothetical protein
MTDAPTFFFSHARQDRETPGAYLRCFFDDLEIKLAQWAGINLQDGPRLGTIDARVPQGANWDAELTQGLGTNRTFVAILTPLYFNRRSCGKEMGEFVFRSRGLGMDPNGALTGVDNVMLIRWLPENAYGANGVKDGLIPAILRLVEDTPADDGRDPERTQAIERYRKKGMEKCVKVEPHYGELLDLFVARIRDMPDLEYAEGVNFAGARNAFEYDWWHHFNARAASEQPDPASRGELVEPQALSSIVAFYVTRRPFTRSPTAVDFAHQLVAEPLPGTAIPTDRSLAALLADMRTAGVAEGINVFHAASNPPVPDSSEPILAFLAGLSAKRVLTALVVDPSVWPVGDDAGAAAVEEIIRSSRWVGPVLIPAIGARPASVEEIAAQRQLPARLVALPEESGVRIAALRRVFVDTRGRVFRASDESAQGAERVPLLKGVGGERA